MSAYPVPDRFDAVAVETELLERWDAEDAFQKSLDIREGAPHFVFYEGPPTANGKPGIHHVMARTIKDLFCRYRTMKGFRVDRKAGWDTHGLPVEIEVEKELGLEGRHAVEAYGIARYNAACRASVLKYKDLWDALTVRMGYWVDLDDPYVTFENDYVESVWNLLMRLWDKGLLYQGHKIQWYSPANGTVLSSHEVSLGYKEVQDVSVVTRFPVVGEEGTSLLAWTTTPWTLPSNVALAVNPRTDYAKVRLPLDGGGHEHVWIAQPLLSTLGADGPEIVATATGADLVGTEYVPPYNDADALGSGRELFGLADALQDDDAPGDAWRVVAADYVTTEDGTGIVHTAPAFGMDDFATGQKEGLPVLNPVQPDGRFREGFPLVGGMWFKDADRPILRDLRERGLLFREDSYVHNYPHDWRKGTPLMQYPVESWFVRTTAVKERMVALNETIGWQPEGIGTGRFGGWLENNVDWALSRSRYWGTPLPIWVSDRDPEHKEIVGSIEALRDKVGGTFPPEAINPDLGTIDLHRPYVDALTWPDGEGGTMRRVPDLIDVWFDSGAMPFAQWHYPFENRERFANNVPADFIAEGVDQTRGWFYTLHAIATLLEDRVAYKNVVVNGLVLDADGNKMSKSKGNAVDPFAALETHGADAVRWSMMSGSTPWDDLRYSDAAIVETRRKTFGTLFNTYRFFAQYAEIDGYVYDADGAVPAAARAELDRWILSRVQATIEEADTALDAYHPTRAARAVETFLNDLSNWYLRRSRKRFWAKGDAGSDRDKQAAYDTLYECLRTVALLMAPIAPFTSDWLWRALGGDASVHLADFPAPDAGRRDPGLEDRMALARAVVTATLALRNDVGVNVRQPLGELSVVTGVGGVEADVLRSVEGIILDEVNVKALDAIAPGSGLIQTSAKPNFKALGRRLGKQMKAAGAAIGALTADQISAYQRGEALTLDLDGAPVELGPGDLDIVSEGVEGRAVRQESTDGADGTSRTVTVALSTEITPALRAEGLAREVTSRVQSLRKEADYDLTDRITVAYHADGELADAIARHADTIAAETLATEITSSAAPQGDAVAEAVLDGATITLAVRRA